MLADSTDTSNTGQDLAVSAPRKPIYILVITSVPKRTRSGSISLATLYEMRKRDILITALVVALWG